MAQQPGSGASSGLGDNIASALCYIVPFASIVFLVLAPYNQNAAVRFHALQSLFLAIAAIVLSIVMSTLSSMLFYSIPLTGALLFGMLQNLFGLAMFLGFLFLAFRAFQGATVEVPVIGEYAKRYV